MATRNILRYVLSIYTRTMSTAQTITSPTFALPITLPQIASALAQMSERDIETLELLMDKKAMNIITKSAHEATQGMLKEL